MKFTLSKKLKFKQKQTMSRGTYIFPWRSVLIFSYAAIALFVAFAISFIYTNLSNAFRSTQEIVVLRTEVAQEIYDIDKFDAVISAIEAKKNALEPVDWERVKNPFVNTSVEGSKDASPPPELPITR